MAKNTEKKDIVKRISEMFPVEEDERWLTNHKLTECPYCGDEMELEFVGLNYNSYSHVAYICPSCGAQSPNFHVDTSLINEVKLDKAIENAVTLISNGLKNKKEEK